MDDVRATQSPVDRIAGAPVSWGVCDGDADIRPSTKHPRALPARPALVA
jgi:hypothetical protein